MKTSKNLGVLVGWVRHRTQTGSILRLQCTVSLERAKANLIEHYDVMLNTRQLRALAHDLTRAADELDGKPPVQKRKWWQI